AVAASRGLEHLHVRKKRIDGLLVARTDSELWNKTFLPTTVEKKPFHRVGTQILFAIDREAVSVLAHDDLEVLEKLSNSTILSAGNGDVMRCPRIGGYLILPTYRVAAGLRFQFEQDQVSETAAFEPTRSGQTADAATNNHNASLRGLTRRWK